MIEERLKEFGLMKAEYLRDEEEEENKGRIMDGLKSLKMPTIRTIGCAVICGTMIYSGCKAMNYFHQQTQAELLSNDGPLQRAPLAEQQTAFKRKYDADQFTQLFEYLDGEESKLGKQAMKEKFYLQQKRRQFEMEMDKEMIALDAEIRMAHWTQEEEFELQKEYYRLLNLKHYLEIRHFMNTYERESDADGTDLNFFLSCLDREMEKLKNVTNKLGVIVRQYLKVQKYVLESHWEPNGAIREKKLRHLFQYLDEEIRKAEKSNNIYERDYLAAERKRLKSEYQTR